MRVLGTWIRVAAAATRRGGSGTMSHRRMIKMLGLANEGRLLQQGRSARNLGGMGIRVNDASYSFASRKRYLCSSADISVEALLKGQKPEGLLHVLRCEVEDLIRRSQDITVKPPRPFMLVKDDPDKLGITLSRMFGLEDITVSCALQLVPKKHQPKPEVGEDQEARTKMLQLTIMITKCAPFPVLVIKCECYRFGFAIHQVDLRYKDEEDSVYRPYFSESKIKLANEFQVFLYKRGLNAELAKFIELHLEKKRLLKSADAVRSFVNFLK